MFMTRPVTLIPENYLAWAATLDTKALNANAKRLLGHFTWLDSEECSELWACQAEAKARRVNGGRKSKKATMKEAA